MMKPKSATTIAVRTDQIEIGFRIRWHGHTPELYDPQVIRFNGFLVPEELRERISFVLSIEDWKRAEEHLKAEVFKQNHVSAVPATGQVEALN